MKFLESGNFGRNYTYVKLEFLPNSDNTLVIFPPSQELIFPIRINPWLQIKKYQSLIPKDVIGNLYILGYDPQLTVETFLADIAEDFGEFIQDKIGPCTIAGISYGGGVAIPFASKFPELTQKLLLVVASYAMSDEGVDLCKKIIAHAKRGEMLQVQLIMASLIKNRLLSTYLKLSTHLRWNRLQYYLNPISTLVNAYTHNIKYNYGLKKYIDKIRAETLIIGGTKDQFFSVELYQELADAIKKSRLVLFENATHTVPVEKIFKVKKLVRDFLKI